MNVLEQALPYILGCAGILIGAAAIGVALLQRHVRHLESAHGPNKH